MADWTTRESELNDSKHVANCLSSFTISRTQISFIPPCVNSLLQGPASNSQVYPCNYSYNSRGSIILTYSCVAVGTVTRLRTGRSGVRFPEGATGFFLFSHTSLLTLQPTPSPTQWSPQVLSHGVKLPELKLTTYFHPVHELTH